MEGFIVLDFMPRAAEAITALAGWMAGGRVVLLAGVIAFAVHLAWQIRSLRIEDAGNCLFVFKSNRDAGLILFAALVVDAAV